MCIKKYPQHTRTCFKCLLFFSTEFPAWFTFDSAFNFSHKWMSWKVFFVAKLPFFTSIILPNFITKICIWSDGKRKREWNVYNIKETSALCLTVWQRKQGFLQRILEKLGKFQSNLTPSVALQNSGTRSKRYSKLYKDNTWHLCSLFHTPSFIKFQDVFEVADICRSV